MIEMKVNSGDSVKLVPADPDDALALYGSSSAPVFTGQPGEGFVLSAVESSPPPSNEILIFESTFEPDDYPFWNQDVGLFTNGNTNVHPKGPVPPEMGLRSLRMKQDNDNAGGLFPPGETDRAWRTITVEAGRNRVRLWRVAHDIGIHVFRVVDALGNILGSWTGTDGLTESEWTPTDHDFIALSDGSVTLEIWYTAPPVITTQSGVKVALLRVYKLV